MEQELKLKRSSIHQRLLPDEAMLKAFGKLNPSVSERTVHFFELWMDSRSHSMQLGQREVVGVQKLNDKILREDADKLCKKLGYLPLWDYQIKGLEIRFTSESDLAMFKINWKK